MDATIAAPNPAMARAAALFGALGEAQRRADAIWRWHLSRLSRADVRREIVGLGFARRNLRETVFMRGWVRRNQPDLLPEYDRRCRSAIAAWRELRAGMELQP